MMKKVAFRRVIAALLLAVMLVQPVFAAEPDQDVAVAQGCHSADAQMNVLGSDRLISNCKAAMLYELNSDTMMYAYEADRSMYPASLVKIMTALIAVEQGDLSDAVTVRQEVLDTVDATAVSVDLQADEVLTLEDLLYCMMVYSANDAAAVIADHICGDQDAFVEKMNAYAEELGCTGTNYVNVHGLHNSDQITTARDVVKILAHASKNESFNRFFNATEYTVPATNKSDERFLVTGNYLMSTAEVRIYYDDRVVGSRTGATALGDRCVASIAQENGMKLLCLIMGAESEYNEDGNKVKSFGGFPETTALLDLGFADGYRPVQLMYQGQTLEQCKVEGGTNDVVLGISTDISTVLRGDQGLNDIRFTFSEGYNQLKAPIEEGQVVGTVSLWNGSVCIGTADIYAMSDVETESPKLSYLPRKTLTAGKIVLIICIVLVAAFGGILCVRWIKTIRVVKQKRRRRHSRRRSR